MKHILEWIQYYYQKYYQVSIIIVTIIISVISQLYFYFHGNQNLSDYDAIARLNIARKIVDSITPGIGQLGGIWPPFPQMLILPFVWNNFLWHSGFAGSIVSGSAFVLGAIFLEKTTYMITKNRMASLLVWFIFVSDINLLLLQTMAMSESFFLFAFIMILYFLIKWVKQHDLIDFLLLGVFTAAITLTRYEGFFIFIGVLLSIVIECLLAYWKKEGKEKVEGMILVFLTVGAFGILLWCLYCWLFYKDPIYWLDFYSTGNNQIATALTVASNASAQHLQDRPITFFDALGVYSTVMLWTNGIITAFLGLTGAMVMGVTMIKKRFAQKEVRIYIPVAIIIIVLFGFLIYGYKKGLIPNIESPTFTFAHLLMKQLNDISRSNMRYGVIMAPLIFLLVGFLAARNKIVGIATSLLYIFQLITLFATPFFLYFSFPLSWGYGTIPSVPWFQSHYHNGLVLISANRHENFMFQTGLPYKTFIYEGTRNYWITSLNEPTTYASWVIYDENNTGDAVNTNLTEHAHWVLGHEYKLVYYENGLRIYHRT